MGRSKERFIEWQDRMKDDHEYDQHMHKQQLWDSYHVYMGQKYFPDGCNVCGSFKSVILTDSFVIYGTSYGNIYLCTKCRSYVGVHDNPNNDHGEVDAPKGLLADEDMRKLRRQAHALFDPMWKEGKLSRTGAYKVLMRVTGVDKKHAHIAMLPKEQLIILINYLKNRKENDEKIK